MPYLRQDVQAEPLVDQWYAWSQLIPPATAARNITERHLKIMDSYLEAPQAHADAVRNPKLLGGPFIDYKGLRVEEIRNLRERTARERKRLIDLSHALSALNQILCVSQRGHSLESLYSTIPTILRGYVELVYDMNHNASFRLMEALLYRSEYYDPSGQALMLSITDGDERPFVLSTPRLPSPSHLQWTVPFADQRLDPLFAMRRKPQRWSFIRDFIGLPTGNDETLQALFTEAEPQPYEPYSGNGLRWRYFGHACVLIETKGKAILFDPVISYQYATDLRRYTYADLPDKIDFAIITHNHIDHLLFETMLQLRHKISRVVVPRTDGGELFDPSMARILANCGFTDVVEIGHLESVGDGDLQIIGMPFLGEHGDLAVTSKLAYLVRMESYSLFFAADSCNLEPEMYRHIHEAFGDVPIVFLGMECSGAPVSWLYGPLMLTPLDRSTDHGRRLSGSNFEQAMEIVKALGSSHVYVYAMGQEPWLNHVMSLKYTEVSKPIVDSNRLIVECKARGLTCERLFGEREVHLDG